MNQTVEQVDSPALRGMLMKVNHLVTVVEQEVEMKLNDLMPNIGAKKVGKRKGHGISAGQGKTAGRGTKGQGSRAGSGGNLYRQGGNLPFFRRLPFIRGEGFTPPNAD